MIVVITRRGDANRRNRRFSERGSATLVVAAGLVVVCIAGLVSLVYLRYQALAHAVRGSADLVALSGAEAWRRGEDACAGARHSASANGVRLDGCSVVGDTLDYVVSVRVSAPVPNAWPGAPDRVKAVAHAGVVDAP